MADAHRTARTANHYEEFLKTAFTTHSYRWTPIGNMDHLRAARVSELQDFFNTYYLPNNATLVIAGDIDIDAARGDGEEIFRLDSRGSGGTSARSPPSRNRPQARRSEVAYRVPLPRGDDRLSPPSLS